MLMPIVIRLFVYANYVNGDKNRNLQVMLRIENYFMAFALSSVCEELEHFYFTSRFSLRCTNYLHFL